MKFEEVVRISTGHGSGSLFLDVEFLKCGSQLGLETLVVRTLNVWILYIIFKLWYKLTRKYLTWGV